MILLIVVWFCFAVLDCSRCDGWQVVGFSAGQLKQ